MTLGLRLPSLLALFVVATGCSTMQAYPGPKLLRNEAAEISGTFEYAIFAAMKVDLKFVDDSPVNAWRVEVPPGEHTIAVDYYSNVLNFTKTSRAPCFITFRAEAGHAYQADGGMLDNGSWHCWIEDTATKDQVAGTFVWPDGWKRGADVQLDP